MTTVTIEKNYKKLENRVGNLEKLVKAIFQDELKPQKLIRLEKISKRLDEDAGKRFLSHREFLRYLKSL